MLIYHTISHHVCKKEIVKHYKNVLEFQWGSQGFKNIFWLRKRRIGVTWYLISAWISRVRFLTCVTKGESRSRSAVTLSVRPKVLWSQLLLNYWSNYHETWYVDTTSYVGMHIGRTFWSPYLCGRYAPWNLENTHKWPCHRNSSDITYPIFMKLGM